MDYNQDIFFKMQQQQMPGKQPFYMTNPIQNLYMTELEYQRIRDKAGLGESREGMDAPEILLFHEMFYRRCRYRRCRRCW